MDTFHIPSEAVGLDELDARLRTQGEREGQIVSSLMRPVIDAFAIQDLAQRQIQTKLSGALRRVITKQDARQDQIANALMLAANQRIAEQAQRQALVETKLPDVRPGGGGLVPQLWVVVCGPAHTPLVLTNVQAINQGYPTSAWLRTFPNQAEANAYAMSQTAMMACSGGTSGGTTGGAPVCNISPACAAGLTVPAALKVTVASVQPLHGAPVTAPKVGDWCIVIAVQPTIAGSLQYTGQRQVSWGYFAAVVQCGSVIGGLPTWDYEIGGGSAAGLFSGLAGGYQAWPGPTSPIPPAPWSGILTGTFAEIGVDVTPATATDLTIPEAQAVDAVCAGGTGTTGGGPGGGPGGGDGSTGAGPVCCAPPTLAAPKDPPKFVDWQCPAKIDVKKGIPLPGTAEWCAAEPDIRAIFVEAGAALTEKVMSWTGMSDWTNGDRAMSTRQWITEQVVPGIALAKSLLDLVASAGKGMVDYLGAMVDCWRDLWRYTPGCSPSEAISLSIIRAVVEWMQKLRIGTDAVLWLTCDISVKMPQILQIVDYLIASSCPVNVPTPPEAMESYLQGQIPYEVYACWMGDHGCNADVYAPVLTARSEKLSPREVIQWSRRHKRPDAQASGDLLDRGWYRDVDRERLVELYDELPSISDHLHWLQRNVFDDEYVTQYKLMQGFEERFWVKFGDDLRAQGMKKEYAALHYAAHWIQPAPGQMREFLYRLRPEVAAAGRSFTVDDYKHILIEQDYAPLAVQWFADTAYRVLAPGHLVALFRYSVLTFDQLVAGYQDFGYDPTRSLQLASMDRQFKARIRASESGGWSPPRALGVWRAGLLTDGELQAIMSGQGYTDLEIGDARNATVADYTRHLNDTSATRARSRVTLAATRAYLTGTVDAQTASQALLSVGFTPTAAGIMLQAEDLRARAQIANKAISTMRRAFLAGELSGQEVLVSLGAAGIVQPRAVDYLTEWQVERTGTIKQASSAQVLRWYTEGLIPQAIAAARLRNLGWDEPDALMLLTEAGMNPNRFARQKASEQKALLRDLMRQEPVSKLRQWYLEGEIDRQTIIDRLTTYGFAQQTITRYLASWDRARADRARKAAEKAAKEERARLRADDSRGEIQRWLRGGEIDVPGATELLTAEGYTADEIGRYLDEWGYGAAP